MVQKLSLQNISKIYQTKKQTINVLSTITLSLHQGEFVSIIGPSGCGKSTLFNIIAGIDEPTSGTIAIDGKMNENRLGKSGYMLQKPLLLPWKTVEENVMLGLTIRNVPEKKAKQQANELLEQFDLLQFANYFPAALSGGMAQRVALLRTVLFNNSFLLMDEPFGALDSLTRLSMQMWLLDVWSKFQSTVLFITHDVREAMLLSDRIYVLSSRPATILQEVKIKLPRPRKRELLRKKEAVKIEQELENILLTEQNSLSS